MQHKFGHIASTDRKQSEQEVGPDFQTLRLSPTNARSPGRLHLLKVPQPHGGGGAGEMGGGMPPRACGGLFTFKL